jgi:D-alanyl-D-alanine dipeptidase
MMTTRTPWWKRWFPGGLALGLCALFSWPFPLPKGNAVAADQTQSAPAVPPVADGPLLSSDLVELVQLDASLRLDIRYAGTNNFLGRAVYRQARAFLQRPAAEALVRAHRSLVSDGYGILVYDGYRPWRVTKEFWDTCKPEQRDYVADPSKGSRHNRGCAVDCTLYDLKTGKEVVMPSGYDEPTERSHAGYTGGSQESRRLRDVLRRSLEREGFTVLTNEWWHFDYKDWRKYPILDVPFENFRK